MTPFRLAYVRGVTPAKWVRAWEQRMRGVRLDLIRTDEPDQLAVLREGRADMAFARRSADAPPLAGDGLHAIPLYEELPVVVVSKDHVIAAGDGVTLADVAELAPPVLAFDGDVETTLAVVASGAGSVLLPQSVARLHARRDLVARPVTDAVPTRVFLAWLSDPRPARTEAERRRVDTFVGIVRGRTVNSSRR